MWTRFTAGMLAACLSFFAAHANAQDAYPNKPLRWIVGYAVGGGSDLIARVLAEQMSQSMGQPIVVVNQPGAAGAIAAATAAKSGADGYTLLSVDNGILVYNTALYKKLAYDPQADFAMVGLTAKLPLILAVGAQTPFQTTEELVAAARKPDARLAYAAGGVGNPHHLATELFKDEAGLQLLPVMYRGGAAALNAVMAGEVPMLVIDTASGLPLIRGGKVRPLGVFGPTRLPALPNVPSLMESGMLKVEATAWQGVVVPTGTPEKVIERLNTEMARALASDAVRKRFEDMGLILTPSTPSQMAALVDKERRFWPPFVKRMNISAE